MSALTLVFFDLEADTLESVLDVSSAVAFFFFFDFDALVSLWSVVVCCAAATRTRMLPVTSSNATNRLNKRGLRDDFISERSFHPQHLWSFTGTQAGVLQGGGEGPRTSAKRVARLECANNVVELLRSQGGLSPLSALDRSQSSAIN